ncbi:MAG: hypothetical protein JXA03_00205, partial [Bacteroidales bacterium]|nr:hypothetical protein [Bacteroidales bacterium]
MNPQKLLLILLIPALIRISPAQQALSWSRCSGPDMNLHINDIQSVDSAVFIAGTFHDSLVFSGTALLSRGDNDIFIASLNKVGDLKWMKRHGGWGGDAVTKLISNGERLFLAGLISDASEHEKDSTFHSFLQISAWDFNGTPDWQLNIESSESATLDVLAAGPGNTLIAGGMFQGALNISDELTLINEERRAFLLIVTTDGKVLKTWQSQGKGQHRAIASCFDQQGNIYSMFAVTAGRFIAGEGAEAHSPEIISNGIVVMKSNPNLDHVWSFPVTGSAFIEGVELVSDYENNIFFGVNYKRSVKMDDTVLFSGSQSASAVVSLNNQGNLRRINAIESSEYCRL